MEKGPERYLGAPPCLAHCLLRATLPGWGYLPLSLDPPTRDSTEHRAGTPEAGSTGKQLQQAPGALSLWIMALEPPRGSCLGIDLHQQGHPRPRTGSGTEPLCKRRRVEAKVCNITRRSGPNHSPSLCESGRRRRIIENEFPPPIAKRVQRNPERAKSKEDGVRRTPNCL